MESSLEIVCPACDGVNRVPAERLHGRPRCGRCQAPLFTGEPAAVDSDARLVRHIERSQIPVLVDFWAEWCGPCRIMAPHFQQAAARLEPEVRLLKADTEALSGAAHSLSIRGIPTLILFRDGQEVARKSGAMEARVICDWTRHQLAQETAAG